MTWHFTHDKAATVSALLHDSATPCFAHAIDHMMNDRIRQEPLERDVDSSFDSWNVFKHATEVVGSSHEPEGFYVSIETKKRNVVPLVKTENGAIRVDAINDEAREIYEEILSYKDDPYAVVDGLGRL